MKRVVHLAVVCAMLVAMLAIMSRVDPMPDKPRVTDVRPFMDDSIAVGQPYKVKCGTVDGGTSTDLTIDVDGGQQYTMTDYTVINTSTTCVRVGFGSRTDTTHGAPVGSGCAGGQTWPMHAKYGRCRSQGAAVVVDVLGGHP